MAEALTPIVMSAARRLGLNPSKPRFIRFHRLRRP